MRLLLLFAALAAGVPLFSSSLFLLENARAGLLQRVRALCGGALVLPVLRAAWNSAWSIGLAALAYPLGWLPWRQAAAQAGQTVPAVLLVHGLYHNASAWFVFRRRLGRAGFGQVRVHAYPSFLRSFEAIAEGLARAIAQAADCSPTGTVLLVGHSLGGLLIRTACARPEIRARVGAIVTLGTPHQGSRLAGLLAVGRLGRGLRPGGGVLERVRGLPACPGPALSLYAPTDSMVLPLSGLLLEERERQSGWTELCLPPMSHIGMLFDRRAAAPCVEFLRAAASRRAVPGAFAGGPPA